MLDRIAIAAALRELGALLALRGENRFKARAYERGAGALESLNADPDRLADEEWLVTLPGIGRALAGTIAELRRTGRSEQLERLRASLPVGVLELQAVPHLTLRRLQALQSALGIESVAELKAACLDGRVATVKGFGPKLVQSLLAGIAQGEQQGEALLLHEAEREGERLLGFARALDGVGEAAIAGALRRCTETVAEIVIAASVADAAAGAAVIDAFVRYPPAVQVLERTATRGRLRLASGALAELETGGPGDHAGLLLAATGAPGHLARLAELAAGRGLRLERQGLVVAATGERLPLGDEAGIYRQLGLPFIPPELREDVGEIEAALAGTLPDDLVRAADIRGMVHCHTVYSDGKHTIEAMARAAEAMGMEYLTITDHSPAAHYANGLTPDRLAEQWDEIARVQEQVRVRLLRGAECDILADGSLDYDDRILEQMDVVIASIHNRHKMDAEQMTRRLVTAMRNPFFKIWGHALGRYVQSRPPIECRVEEVLDAAAGSRVAIEVNGDPHRLDLEPRWQRAARTRGLRFVVATDAHSTGQLQNLRFGIAMARRGWVRREETLNTLGAEEFMAAVRPR